MVKNIFLCVLLSMSLPLTAKDLPDLPKGISTWNYTPPKNLKQHVRDFNEEAADHLQFKYFFPYTGSVTADPKSREVSVYYNSDNSRACRSAMPSGTLIMPIVDGRADKKEFSNWTDDEYKDAAKEVAKAILRDRSAAGVQIDIEPFDESHLPFYKHLTEMLNERGKVSTLFVGAKPKPLMLEIFKSCNIVILSGYDSSGENPGPKKFEKRLNQIVKLCQTCAEETGKHYMVGIPASAAWGEYEYIVKKGGKGRKDTGHKQSDYIKAAIKVLAPYKSSKQYLGAALWSMGDLAQEDEPEKVKKTTYFPNYIRPDIWELLKNY